MNFSVSFRSWRAIGMVVAAYAIFAGAWIFLSDLAVAAVARTPDEAIRWQHAKGIVFVLFSAGLIGALLWRELQRRDAVQNRLERLNRTAELIGACRQVLAADTAAPVLLRKYCEVTVERGGYRAAGAARWPDGPEGACEWIARAGGAGALNDEEAVRAAGRAALAGRRLVVRSGASDGGGSDAVVAVPVEAGPETPDAGLVWLGGQVQPPEIYSASRSGINPSAEVRIWGHADGVRGRHPLVTPSAFRSAGSLDSWRATKAGVPVWCCQSTGEGKVVRTGGRMSAHPAGGQSASAFGLNRAGGIPGASGGEVEPP